jgi:hypothetical protein
MKIEDVLKQALEALGTLIYSTDFDLVIKAKYDLRQAIAVIEKAPPEAQTEAEKTAFAFGWFKALEAQPKAEQSPLTDEQIAEISVECATVTPSDIYFARAIEKAHGIGDKA